MIDVAHTEATSLLHILGIDLAAVPVVDEDALAAALDALSTDPAEHQPDDTGTAEHLAALLLADKDQYQSTNTIDFATEEKLTNLSLNAAATMVHDALAL